VLYKQSFMIANGIPIFHSATANFLSQTSDWRVAAPLLFLGNGNQGPFHASKWREGPVRNYLTSAADFPGRHVQPFPQGGGSCARAGEI